MLTHMIDVWMANHSKLVNCYLQCKINTQIILINIIIDKI